MKDVNDALEKQLHEAEQELRTDFEGLQADYRGKHEEEKQVMKLTLETAVGEFERSLDTAYNMYYESTRKQTEKYKWLQTKDLKAINYNRYQRILATCPNQLNRHPSRTRGRSTTCKSGAPGCKSRSSIGGPRSATI